MTIHEIMRSAYEQGLFPMADSRDPEAEVHWYRPPRDRAVYLPENFHVPARLARLVRQAPFEIRWNDDLRAVMTSCRDTRGQSWINAPLIDAFAGWAEATDDLYCLSVFRDGQRVGGIYGVQLGALCTAESMFSLVPNASSVALVVLVAGLFKAGIEVIDAQIANAHTKRFHLNLWSDARYRKTLAQLVPRRVELKEDYFCFDVASSFVQSLTHTS